PRSGMSIGTALANRNAAIRTEIHPTCDFNGFVTRALVRWSRRATMVTPDLLRKRILLPVDSSRKAGQQPAVSQIRQPGLGGVETDVQPHLCAGEHIARKPEQDPAGRGLQAMVMCCRRVRAVTAWPARGPGKA